MRTNGPRKHHFVPRFHLDMFAGGKRRELGVFDKKWGKVGLVPAASTARVRDYYLIPGATAVDRLRIESDFARLEDLVAPVIRSLDDSPPGPVYLGDNDRWNLAAYIAILHVRVPAYRDASLRQARELSEDPEALGLADREGFRLAARRHGLAGSDEQLERLRQLTLYGLATRQVHIQIHPAASLGGLTPAMERGLPLLLEREWELLHLQQRPGLLIGDQPVGLLSKGQLAPSIGFGSPDVQVFVPLSPQTLLLISSRPRRAMPLLKKYESGRSLDEPWWAIANKVAWLTSQRYVWGRQADIQATALLLPDEFRRRDLRVLDEVQEARRQQVARFRRAERRSGERDKSEAEASQRARCTEAGRTVVDELRPACRGRGAAQDRTSKAAGLAHAARYSLDAHGTLDTTCAAASGSTRSSVPWPCSDRARVT